MKMITTFPDKIEYDNAMKIIKEKGIIHEIIDPSPGYSYVGIPAIILEEEIYRDFVSEHGSLFVCSGWVDFRETSTIIPQNNPPVFTEDLFGSFSIVSLAPCVADYTKLRMVAKFSQDISKVLPYVNTDMPYGMYLQDVSIFSYLEGYHMISLYPYKITIAKTDDIKDTWKVLEKIRCKLNDIWSRRNSIEPSYEIHQKPPALEVFKRLPALSCGECGEKTCMAFALRLWNGEVKPELCKPVFNGDYIHLKSALLDICAGLGIKVTL